MIKDKNNRNIKINNTTYIKIKRYADKNGYKLKSLIDQAVELFIKQKEREKEQMLLLDNKV